jgi:hypothetical protein
MVMLYYFIVYSISPMLKTFKPTDSTGIEWKRSGIEDQDGSGARQIYHAFNQLLEVEEGCFFIARISIIFEQNL